MKWAWAVIAAAASHVDKGLALLIASYPKEREREGSLATKHPVKKLACHQEVFKLRQRIKEDELRRNNTLC